MHAFLDRLGRGAARFHWFVIAGWLVVVVGLFVLRSAFGGTYVNNYTVPGSESSAGLNILNKDFASAGGYSGSIVFHAKTGTVSEHADAVKSSSSAVVNSRSFGNAIPTTARTPDWLSKTGSATAACALTAFAPGFTFPVLSSLRLQVWMGSLRCSASPAMPLPFGTHATTC